MLSLSSQHKVVKYVMLQEKSFSQCIKKSKLYSLIIDKVDVTNGYLYPFLQCE
jgi:hypothetical protein